MPRTVAAVPRAPGHPEVAGRALVITLDRPKANAIDVTTSRALYQSFDRLRRGPRLRVAILTGAGGRFFSAGWDLKAAADGEGIEADHGPGGFAGLTEFLDIGKPVIAAVNGLAFGGGFELVLAADLVVAAEHAEFALTEVTLGLVPDAGAAAPLAVAAALGIMRETEAAGTAAGYAIQRGEPMPAYRAMLGSQDALEGARAFAERRAPRWLGR